MNILALDLAGPLPGVPYESATPDDLAETATAVGPWTGGSHPPG